MRWLVSDAATGTSPCEFIITATREVTSSNEIINCSEYRDCHVGDGNGACQLKLGEAGQIAPVVVAF